MTTGYTTDCESLCHSPDSAFFKINIMLKTIENRLHNIQCESLSHGLDSPVFEIAATLETIGNRLHNIDQVLMPRS